MTIKHREPFLNHLANRLGREPKTSVQRPTWTYEPQKELYNHLSVPELVTMLEKQCATIHTTFKRTTKQQLAQTLQTILDEIRAHSIMMPQDKRTKKLGLEPFFAQLEETGKQVRVWENMSKQAAVTFAEQADVGIAYSDITLAESGTVTLLHNDAHGRTLTLLPKTFIAIIEKETIVPRLTEAVAQIRKRQENDSTFPTCISFVSGPSNSADIELNLIVGVHGPVQAYYIYIDE